MEHLREHYRSYCGFTMRSHHLFYFSLFSSLNQTMREVSFRDPNYAKPMEFKGKYCSTSFCKLSRDAFAKECSWWFRETFKGGSLRGRKARARNVISASNHERISVFSYWAQYWGLICSRIHPLFDDYNWTTTIYILPALKVVNGNAYVVPSHCCRIENSRNLIASKPESFWDENTTAKRGMVSVW